MGPSVFFVAFALGVGAVSAAQEQVYRVGDGVTAPVIVKEVRPEYTTDALAARVEGVVRLECVVSAEGKVTEGRVIAPLYPSLDREALHTVAEWLFKPATKAGKPVAVRVEIEMAFTLLDAAQPRRGPPLDSPEVYKTQSGVTQPVPIHEVRPSYSSDAMRERISGRVDLECVVLPDGAVGDIRVTKSVHPGLDREARRALKRWTFKPGTKDGVAVPVQIQVQMFFTLGPLPR